MADSLFDNRYRYDYIYPRGRSGETLRAVDTAADGRPVVIKRPAPNDAPPIRAGQEVSIINEREALTRLAGHPVLTELLGMGQFFVGGIPHQYIVMERAEGIIVADEVAALAVQHQRMPELEMLEIVGGLIHLLQLAHSKDIVYNDVDAKHLFWNRDNYSLKVIDWGNAVFLEGDEITSQGISRQTDVYQIGELLYFILSGGVRAEVPRDAGPDFKLDFHQDAEQISARLQAIVSKAVHPNSRYRYSSLTALNADLARYRSPLEQARNQILSRSIDKLKNPNLSRSELMDLQTRVESALKQNPAYPVARDTYRDIDNRLRDLAASADLDAVKIYMGNGNWPRAVDLLDELRQRAGSQTAGIVHLLLDWCLLLMDARLAAIPEAITESAALLFEYKPDKAANALLLRPPDDSQVRRLQWQMAERISARFPDVLLLRPNLYRLDDAVQTLEADGIPVDEVRGILRGINRSLDETARMDKPRAARLRDTYREVVDSIGALYTILQTLSLQHEFSEQHLPLDALTRALNAAMALADNIHVIGKQAASSPRDALTALDASRAINPPNAIWDQIEDFLSHLYEILQTSQTYVPAVDGSDLEHWLKAKQDELLPFSEQLFDEMLRDMLEGLQTAEQAWRRYREVVVAGSKTDAIQSLEEASQTVTTISPTLSSWLKQLGTVVESAPYIERHSVPGHLGRTLADGWAAFDRGQLANAERLGQQALEIARSENERGIAERLWRVSRLLREWVERNGVESETRTQDTLIDIEKLFSASETATIEAFAAQMPSTETYLKAMGQGLVQVFAASSTASLRILFAQYALSGALDAHDDALDDARFWRAAAIRTLPSTGEIHAAVHTLDAFIDRRRALLAAQSIFATVDGKHILGAIDEICRQLESSPQSRLLTPGIQSLRTLEAAVQDWADAEFRAAGGKIEQVIRAITETETSTQITLGSYRAWMMELQAAAAELSVKRRSMLQEIDRQLDEPQPLIRDVIHLQASLTEELLGQLPAKMMVGWRDTYVQFLNIYGGELRRSHKLEEMNKLFKSLFIERNPTYPLLRHWYRLTESSPEFPAIDAEPLPEADDEEERLEAPDESAPAPAAEDVQAAGFGRALRIGAAFIAIALVIGGLAVLARNGDLDSLLAELGLAQTPTASATVSPTITATSIITRRPTAAPTVQAATEIRPSSTPQRRQTDALPAALAPTEDNTELPTATDTAPPTATDTPTQTATASVTPTPTLTLTATLPAAGLQGAQDLLDLYHQSSTRPLWDDYRFARQNGVWRLGGDDQADGPTLFFAPPPELLEQRFGNDAPRRISRIEANLTLHIVNPAAVADEEAYFGLLFQSTASADDNAGIKILAVGDNAINLALYENGESNFISQRSVNALIARLRLDRDLTTGRVTAFFNDSQIGEPMRAIAVDDAAAPVIFVKNGGVTVGVTAWQITLE